MIITRTPLRVGLVGGGSDLPSYFEQSGLGKVINFTIDKYVYVLVRKRHDNGIYLKYSENEMCDITELDSLQHDFIRETLKYMKIDYGLEIINFADIPTKGTGLGSSSSFLVGLLLALHTLNGHKPSKQQLAQEACHIEIKLCGKPIGYQDQYAAAYGGFNTMSFLSGDEVIVDTFSFDDMELKNFSRFMMMFYTGIQRDSSKVLATQSKNMVDDKTAYTAMEHNVTLTTALQTDLKVSPRFFDTVGITLEQNWQLKKKFASGISNALIDKMHKTVMDAGADGAKITGAGGGGFLVVFCNPWRQDEVRIAIEKQFAGTELNMKEMPFEIDRYGSRILMDMEVATW